MSSTVQRKLTTILAADAVGYSRAMEQDELNAVTALRAARSVFSKFIERHNGRIVNTAGDGLIAEFPSVVEAVQCAVEVQNELGSGASTDTMRFRIGVHLGDVIIDGSDLLGEGVNLAARLESMSEPGGVLISQQVYDQVQHKLSVGFEYLGEKRPKNFTEDVPVYRLTLGNERRRKPVSKAPGNAQPASRSQQSADVEYSEPQKLRERVIHYVKLLGLVWVTLLVVNLATGSTFWAHWPGLAMAVFVGLKAAPLFVQGWFKLAYVRAVVVVIALILINLITWAGYPWVLWPAGVLVVLGLMRNLSAGKT